MLKFKKILPVVFATALIFSGCGSDAPAADGTSAGADAGSFIEENTSVTEDEPLSAPDETLDGAEAADGSSSVNEENGKSEQAGEKSGSNTDASKASGSEKKADASKAATSNSGTTASAKNDTSKAAAAAGTASSSKPAASSSSAAASSAPAAPAAAEKPAEPTYKYKDGTYSGSAQGFNGPIGVSVTISKDKITAVSVTSSTDDEPYITNAKALCSHIVSANSADVSGVSGATYSSNGIKGAVKAALAKAKN